MNNMNHLDVLVVYSAGVAISASVADSLSKHPFLLNSKQADYNLTYAYFLRVCKEKGIKAGFASSSDITGAGECSNYWNLVANHWHKVHQSTQADQVFDKISPISKKRASERKLLLADNKTQPFNDVKLFNLFFDKLHTYQRFAQYSIPTVNIADAKTKSIFNAVTDLKAIINQHVHYFDFGRSLIIKDRHGAGGNHVYKVDQNFVSSIQKIMTANPSVSFVLQPFLLFDRGFSFNNRTSATDIRMIFQHNNLLQTYVRMAKDNDFRCNIHQGGQILYLEPSDIPEPIQLLAKKIVKKINKPHSLYALDFAVSNSGRVYFVEGNIGPGINWDANLPIDEKKAKELIRNIVAEMANRTKKIAPQKIKPASMNYNVGYVPTLAI